MFKFVSIIILKSERISFIVNLKKMYYATKEST